MRVILTASQKRAAGCCGVGSQPLAALLPTEAQRETCRATPGPRHPHHTLGTYARPVAQMRPRGRHEPFQQPIEGKDKGGKPAPTYFCGGVHSRRRQQSFERATIPAMYRASARMRARPRDPLLTSPVRQKDSTPRALRLLPTGWCKTKADLDALYPDGRRYLLDRDTGEKVYLSDEAAHALEEGMLQVPEALARLEARRRAWQKTQQQQQRHRRPPGHDDPTS